MSFTTPALQVQRLSMQAVLPGTRSLQASDYTLHSAYDLVVPAHGKALVRTDCAISAPPGFRLGVFALPGQTDAASLWYCSTILTLLWTLQLVRLLRCLCLRG